MFCKLRLRFGTKSIGGDSGHFSDVCIDYVVLGTTTTIRLTWKCIGLWLQHRQSDRATRRFTQPIESCKLVDVPTMACFFSISMSEASALFIFILFWDPPKECVPRISAHNFCVGDVILREFRFIVSVWLLTSAGTHRHHLIIFFFVRVSSSSVDAMRISCYQMERNRSVTHARFHSSKWMHVCWLWAC